MGENKIINLPDILNSIDLSSFLLTSRSAFSHFKFYNDIELMKKEFPNKNVIDFVLDNQKLSLDDFTEGITFIIDKSHN